MATAQSPGIGDEPAEFPPASYKGAQYVDSRGCVYIRAGIDGNVTWVPRVNRSRTVICGYKPSLPQLAGAAPAPTPAPKVKPEVIALPAAKPTASPQPVKVQPEIVMRKPVKPQAAQVPARAAETPPARVVKAAPRATIAPKAAPKVAVRVAAPARVTAAPEAPATSVATARQVPGAAACVGGSAVSTLYINDGSRYEVRCGSQTEGLAGLTLRGRAGTAEVVTAYAPADEVAAPEPRIPAGYQAVWEDDRLNPNRGRRTAEGDAQMALVWTETVPRRLVDTNSGRDVTRKHPGLLYPYTSTKAQEAALKRGARIVTRAEADRLATLSTRRPAPKAVSTAKAGAGHRFVQVGTYGVPSNAKAAAARLASAGLPARIGRYSKNGKSYQVVLAGPFADAASLRGALGTVRGAGFSDAFTRR